MFGVNVNILLVYVSRFLHSLRSVEMTSGCDSFRDVAPSAATDPSVTLGRNDRDYQSFAHLLYWVVGWSFLNLLISILIE